MQFEWALGGEILLQRSDIPVEGFPDSFGVITTDASGAHLQHHFDSRGVVRVGAFDDGEHWQRDFSVTYRRTTAAFGS